MPFRSFNEFAALEPVPTDYLVGFRPLAGEFKVDFYTLSKIISGGLTISPNILYVSLSGSDTAYRGIAENEAFRTIKRACFEAAKSPANKYTVFIRSGDYYEENPVYVPPNTSLIGDNLRRVNIYPNNPTYDILWVSNADYIYGFTFRGHLYPSAAVAFPQRDVTKPDYRKAFFTPGLSATQPSEAQRFVVTSPYIQGSSSIARSTPTGANNAGAGCRIDGSLVNGYLRSMVMDSYTQFNEGGIGIHIINNGYAQLVSTFTICCTHGILCESGGGCDINTSNCSFGNYGLVSKGKSPMFVLSGRLLNPVIAGNDSITINQAVSTNLAISPALGLIFSLSGDTTNTLYIVGSAVKTGTNLYNIYIDPPTTLNRSFEAGRVVYFYIRSNILASAITFEYIGTGTDLTKSLPILGGQTNVDNEVVQEYPGVVFYTATNQSGDFKIGSGLTIRQATGTIEGQTFQRSIFSLVTPFTLAIE
jgi:hypothetical protein